MGLDNYVCDELPWAMRETLRASGQEELSLLGWCIGGAVVAMHAALEPESPARNLVLLTTPVDTSGSLYGNWVGRDSFDPEFVTEVLPSVPGAGIDWANKMMKPVTNFWTTYRTLWQNVLEGEADREAYQSMARWVADNPPFPGRAYSQWITWMYKENRFVNGGLRLRGPARRPAPDRAERARRHCRRGSHRAPRRHAAPARHGRQRRRDASRSPGRAHRPDGRLEGAQEIWPDIAEWLESRSAR